MTYSELYPVVVAILIWGQSLANLRILFHIDNQAVVHIVNKQNSKSPEVMTLVMKFVLNPLLFNITLKYINT